MKKVLFIILAIIIVIAIWVVVLYNGLVSKNEAVSNQWAQVETVYQRRFDLIPNLVESVKGVMKQEQKVFGDIADARTGYMNAQTSDQKAAAATQVEGSLARLLVVMENYPQLKSSENVRDLQSELAGSENRISVERMRYNDTVRLINQSIKRFPTNVIAGMLGFGERVYFQSAPEAAQAPKVDMSIE